MRLLRLIAIVLGIVLALSVAGLAACQRSLIYFPSKEVIAPNYPGVRAERIRTEDGETLVAWHHAPPVINGVRGPIFLFFDGNAGRPEIQPGRWQRLVEGGAGFLAVYYRGYSGSTGHPTETGLHSDARAGYEWLIAHGYRPQDIVIHGFSLGSGVAVRLAAERPARALILEAPFTGIDDVARLRVSSIALLLSDRFASREWIGQVHMPVLIVHGDADTVIPFSQGEHLFTLANEPKAFVRMRGSDHATLARDGLYTHVWEFLTQHPGD